MKGEGEIVPRSLLPCIALILCVRTANAAPRDDETAEQAFREGRALMAQRRFDEACARFETSQRAAPGIGTLLNLGDCYEQAGKLAHAWRTYNEALGAAQAADRKDRIADARAAMDLLKPKMSWLVVRPWPGDEHVTISVDGAPLDRPFPARMPVDPGNHVVVVSAPTKRTWKTDVMVDPAREMALDVPALDAATQGGPMPAGETQTTFTTTRFVAIGAASAGVLLIGVGTYFGFSTISKWDEATSHCPGDRCDARAPALSDEAASAGTAATVAFIAGGVLVAAGATLWFLGKPGGALGLSPGGGSRPTTIVVEGRWP